MFWGADPCGFAGSPGSTVGGECEELELQGSHPILPSNGRVADSKMPVTWTCATVDGHISKKGVLWDLQHIKQRVFGLRDLGFGTGTSVIWLKRSKRLALLTYHGHGAGTKFCEHTLPMT